MKKIFKSLIVGLVFTLLFTSVPFEAECQEISDEVFRLHILANSDSQQDQELKLKVRDAVICCAENVFSDVHSKEEAKTAVEENIDEFRLVAQNVIKENGYDYPVTLVLVNMYFDTRYYGDVTMPSGFYDALRIEIGNAKGKNWWCVMYPSLCIYSAAKTDSLEYNLSDEQYDIISSDGEYEFRFKLVEIFSGICDKLTR